MIIDSSTAVRHLQALERQLAEAPRHEKAVRMASARGDRYAGRCAVARADQHVCAMAITTAQLRAYVVPADGLGTALESLSELVLRAARMVALVELTTLPGVVDAACDGALSRRLSWGRFRGLAELTACVRAELDRILEPCPALRGRAQSDRPAYRTALREAHAARYRLATASEFARFLWEGRSRADWPPLQALCKRISIALTVRIDIAPEDPLVAYPSAREGCTMAGAS